MLEFFIKSISAIEMPLLTQSGKSMVSIVIRFHRELGNMVNTYFQTFLLCLMAYLTLYINLADFGNRYISIVIITITIIINTISCRHFVTVAQSVFLCTFIAKESIAVYQIKP